MPTMFNKPTQKRAQGRVKGVLPVRLFARNSDGVPFQDIVHTLDITPNGARLGAVRRHLQVQDRVIVQFRQCKTEFRVVWIKSLKNTSECQVGLQSLGSEDAWSSLTDYYAV
jgi:hypothetical protein